MAKVSKRHSRIPKIFLALVLFVGARIYHGDSSFFIPNPNRVKNEYTVGNECISFLSLLLLIIEAHAWRPLVSLRRNKFRWLAIENL